MKRSSTVEERKYVNVLHLAAFFLIVVLLVTSAVLAENSSPLISNIVILLGSKVNSTSFVNISATVFDIDSISRVFAVVVLPDGRRDDVVLLPDGNNNENHFSGLFLNTSLKGIYSVEIIANDSLNNIGTSDKINFSVLDNIPPSVSNLQTVEGSSSTKFDAMLILADIKDNFEISAVFAEITLPNSTKKLIVLVPFSGVTYAGDFPSIKLDGEYLVEIIANDSSNNINNSEYVSFTIDSQSLTVLEDNQVFNIIDLAVNTSDIQFSNSNPIEGENVIVNATIHNFGDLAAANVKVQFLDSGTEIRNATINVSAFSTSTILTNWTAKIGSRNIQVKIDPGNLIAESNETNNNASRNLSISAHFIFFGKATSLVGLGLGFDFLFAVQSEIKNTLVTDSDSNLDFSSLQALSRKNDSSLASNDFTQVDAALGMGNFSDSISNLFSIGGSVPKQTRAFNIYDSTINNVPIINSTNSSVFLTGMLWDYSDDSNGEFDNVEKEDLVFVAETNVNKMGSFGTYDYEIKIPVLLRDYKGTKASVDMYFEVK